MGPQARDARAVMGTARAQTKSCGAQAMTPDERLARIAELQREADEGRARIAERIARRERDPGGELERLMCDQRFTKDASDLVYTDPAAISHDAASTEKWAEPIRSAHARKNDEPVALAGISIGSSSSVRTRRPSARGLGAAKSLAESAASSLSLRVPVRFCKVPNDGR